ncbi:hypothetical protein [Bizionia arctica]|uniref:Uncharacterized protein n=1 Tax=Bizionia arctica TaxID=1495645 RepID=A0A917GN93_9FLAO|nr:hypothetical protein [Bizionia arctica]GGG52040.1 hypothetical protein GCM10010976_23980 [Bizionia arctica]
MENKQYCSVRKEDGILEKPYFGGKGLDHFLKIMDCIPIALEMLTTKFGDTKKE